jgi:hypothetical protein
MDLSGEWALNPTSMERRKGHGGETLVKAL